MERMVGSYGKLTGTWGPFFFLIFSKSQKENKINLQKMNTRAKEILSSQKNTNRNKKITCQAEKPPKYKY